MPGCPLNVILDIDETFVYFINKKYRAHSWDKLSESEKAKYQYNEVGGHVLILRPHLQEFLDFLFANCSVSLWTWSDAEYADMIATTLITALKPDSRVRFVLSEEDAARSAELHGHSKDLNMLWYSEVKPCFAECNTVLIDDLPNNTIHPSNRKNSITVRPFAPFGEKKDRTERYMDMSNDTTLLEVIEILGLILNFAGACYGGENQWESLFSTENIREMGLSKYIHTIEYSPFKNKEMAKLPPVKAIGAGDSYHFLDLHPGGAAAALHGGGKRTRRVKRNVQRKSLVSKKHKTRRLVK